MATSGKLAEAVSNLTGVPLGTVKFYQAALRQCGAIATGGRGRSARSVTVEDAVSLLLAVIVARSADQVSEALELANMSVGSDPFIANGRYRLTTEEEAQDRLDAFIEEDRN